MRVINQQYLRVASYPASPQNTFLELHPSLNNTARTVRIYTGTDYFYLTSCLYPTLNLFSGKFLSAYTLAKTNQGYVELYFPQIQMIFPGFYYSAIIGAFGTVNNNDVGATADMQIVGVNIKETKAGIPYIPPKQKIGFTFYSGTPDARYIVFGQTANQDNELKYKITGVAPAVGTEIYSVNSLTYRYSEASRNFVMLQQWPIFDYTPPAGDLLHIRATDRFFIQREAATFLNPIQFIEHPEKTILVLMTNQTGNERHEFTLFV